MAAATTTTALVERFGARRVVFTGVAGGVGDGVQVGDVVVARGFVQHDLDASPAFSALPDATYGRSIFDCDPLSLLSCWKRPNWPGRWRSFYAACCGSARVHHGLIASGDRFVNGPEEAALVLVPPCRQPATPRWPWKWKAPLWPRCAPTTACPLRQCAPFQTVPTTQAHVDFPQFVKGCGQSLCARIVTV